MPVAGTDVTMVECAHQFGPGGRLVGVLTKPSADHAASTACLLFNAGVLHRVGPHRIHVKLARELARRGVPTLRMDLSGVGDSSPAPYAAVRLEQTIADLREGMALIEDKTGATRIVTGGICSAACDAFHLALQDGRVVGAFMFDGYSFPTVKTHVVRRWRRFQHAPWRAVPLAALRSAAAFMAGIAMSVTTSRRAKELTAGEFAAGLGQLVERGTKVFIGYSGSVFERHNYESQLADAFPGAAFLSKIDYAYLPHLDHTLTSVAAQREFIRLVADWAMRVVTSSGDSSREKR
jgi:hypothetical protein